MEKWKKAKKWVIAAVLLILAVVVVVWAVKVFKNKKSKLPEHQNMADKASLGTIDRSEGKVKVGESETKELYINTENMNLYVQDKNSKVVWNAIAEKENGGMERSLLSITYLGEDNSIKEWDSYTYCVDKESYTMERIENGVRIRMNFNAGELMNFYEYMPQKISVERYESLFYGGLEELKNSGELDEAQYNRYVTALDLVYSKSISEGAYTVNYVGQPPISAVAQLIQVTKLVGYTQEMLLEDAETYGFVVEFEEPAEFNLVFDAYLEGDELVVNVPGSQIESVNDYYVIQNIKLLPNFFLTKSQDVTDGYLLIPDGSGALMKMNSYQAKVAEYVRSVYKSDFFKEYYYLSEYGEDLMMPVFGMLYNEGTKDPSAFLGIIESGADSAYITASLGSADESDVGVVYNKIYASFDTVQYDQVKVFGEYSDNSTSYLVRTGLMPIDYTIRYILYPEQTGYYEMAKDYQSYLLRGRTGHEAVYQTDASLYLNVLGGVTLKDRILGIPYNYEDTLTSYKQTKEILESLGDRNVMLCYEGAYAGGLENKMLNNSKFTSINGSKKEWKELKDYLNARGTEFYISAPFLRVYNSGHGYVTKLHALSDFSSDPVNIRGFSLEEAMMYSQGTSSYYMVRPSYLKSLVSRFLSSEDEKYNLNLTDLANQYYADYKSGNMVMPYAAQDVVNEAISSLSEGRKLAMQNPRADKLPQASVAVDVSRESCNYTTFDTSIPFRQLVMNGMCNYTTTNVNNNSKSAKYYLLQAIETGSMLKYTVMAESTDRLKNSNYTYYYDVQYSQMEEEIKALYDEYAEAMKEIGSTQIVNHTILAENVFLTEYASGVRIITNYNKIPAVVGEEEIEGLGYKLLRKGE